MGRRNPTRNILTRIHLWLGWLIGVPMLFWTVSGLWMVHRPIDEVRATHLRAEAIPLAKPPTLAWPEAGSHRIESLTLEQQALGTRWVIRFVAGDLGRADPATGALLGAVTAPEAQAIARAGYKGDARIIRVTRFAKNANPIDLRKGRPAWQVQFSDNANLYIDAESGSILALRTAQWRIYDMMWGLHIMDLQGRENSNHPVLILFAALSAFSVFLALILLPIASWRQNRRLSLGTKPD